MKSKNFLSILAGVLLLATSAYAHEKMSADDVVQKLKTELNLTQAQVDSIKPIIADSLAKKQALWDQAKTAKDAVHQQAEQLEQNKEDALSKILTPDQLSKYKDMKKEHHQGMNKGGHHQDTSSSK